MKRRLIEALLITLAIMLGANLAWSAEGLHILKGRSYLLQDEFTDTLAAGAVNNTSTFPGGWKRTVVDTYATTNIVANGADFSGGPPPTSWAAVNSAAITAEAGGKAGNCLQVKNVGSAAGGAKQTLNTIAGKTYNLTYYQKNGLTTGYLKVGTTAGASDLVNTTGITNADWAASAATASFVATGASTYLEVGCTSTTTDDTTTFDTISVIPTTGLLSTANGSLTFAGGKATGTYADPQAYYPQVVRTAGLTLLSKFNQTSGNLKIGFEATTSGTILDGFTIQGTSVSSPMGGVTWGLMTAGTDYLIATSLRSPTGSYSFIKGGSQYSKWSMFPMLSSATNSPMYIYVGNYSGPSTVDYLRIPTQKYIPVPICYDTFDNATIAQAITSHMTNTTGPDSQSTPSLAWTGGEHWTISAGTAKNSPVGGDEALTNGNFAAWTGDNPDSFNLLGTEDAGSYVTEVAGKARIVTDGDLMGLTQSILSVGSWYVAQVDVTAAAAGALRFNIGGVNDGYFTSVANSQTATARVPSNTTFTVSRVGACDVTIDNLSVKPLTLSDLLVTHPSSTPDVLQSVVVGGTPSGTQAGLALNWNTDRTYGIVCYIDGSTAKCDQNVNGTWSLITGVTGMITYNTAYTLAVWKSGAKIRLYYNNALVGAEGTTDAAFDTPAATTNSRTNHGLFSTYSTNTFDGYTIFPVGTSNEHSTLDIINQ